MNIEEFKLKIHDIMLTNINWMISSNLEKNNAQARRKLFAEWGGDYSDEKLSEYAYDCINVLIENRIFEKLIPSDNIDYEDVEVQWRMSGEFIFNYKGDYCFTVDHKSFASSYGQKYILVAVDYVSKQVESEDDVVSDEVLNKKTEEYSHMKPLIQNTIIYQILL